MTEKRFILDYSRIYEQDIENPQIFNEISYEQAVNLLNGLDGTIKDLSDDYQKLMKENEQLKEALREELQDNGNAYYIEIFDKLFNLNYAEWNRNERYRECTDWEKVLKDKGDME